MAETLKYADTTGKVLGCGFEVHKYLGNGFQEVIYQRAMAYEMTRAGLAFAREIVRVPEIARYAADRDRGR